MPTDKWIFEYKTKTDKMDEEDLLVYQSKLVQLKNKYSKYLSDLPECVFYDGEMPPKNNVFAQFHYRCSQHEPKCTGWTLYWNPNEVKEKHLLNGSHRNTCAPSHYKRWIKRIQAELELACFAYFKLFHEGDNLDCYKLTDSFYLSHIEADEELNAASVFVLPAREQEKE